VLTHGSVKHDCVLAVCGSWRNEIPMQERGGEWKDKGVIIDQQRRMSPRKRGKRRHT